MALLPDPKLKEQIERLLVSFSPIYALWRGKQEAKQRFSEKAEDCLADDVMKIGCYMMAADNVSRVLESRFPAEILACLKSEYDNMPYEYELTTIDTAIAQEKYSGDKIPDLLTLHIIKSWVVDHNGNKDIAGGMLIDLASLANRIVMRDGKLTNEELARLNVLEKYLVV